MSTKHLEKYGKNQQNITIFEISLGEFLSAVKKTLNPFLIGIYRRLARFVLLID